jgi:hypothetical protein
MRSGTAALRRSACPDCGSTLVVVCASERFPPERERRANPRSTITIQCQLNLLQFSPDARSLLASACDGTARLFDVASLGEIGTPFQGPVNIERSDAVYTLGGRRMVVAYQTGEAYVWDVALADWKQHACAVAGRNLTRDEWRFFLPGRSYHAVCSGLPAQHL